MPAHASLSCTGKMLVLPVTAQLSPGPGAPARPPCLGAGTGEASVSDPLWTETQLGEQCPPLPLPAPGCCLIAHEKKAYLWLETPEAAIPGALGGCRPVCGSRSCPGWSERRRKPGLLGGQARSPDDIPAKECLHRYGCRLSPVFHERNEGQQSQVQEIPFFLDVGSRQPRPEAPPASPALAPATSR